MITKFQSTYLYKVRRLYLWLNCVADGFNPRTYIRYDSIYHPFTTQRGSFNPRTYIRYDKCQQATKRCYQSFNPRTYIRYDLQKSSEDGGRGFNPRTYIRYDLYGFY